MLVTIQNNFIRVYGITQTDIKYSKLTIFK